MSMNMSASFVQLDEIRLDISTALVACLVFLSFVLKQVPIFVQVFFDDRVLDLSWINCRSSLVSGLSVSACPVFL